jgi:ParB family transcriptional regulator, chromosome partitioning protein
VAIANNLNYKIPQEKGIPMEEEAGKKKMTPKQRGLGRGLDALFDDEEATFAATATAPQEAGSVPSAGRKVLGIGQLMPNPDQPRQYFDPAAISDLAASIRQHGLLQPILVRPIPNKPDMYEIVAGERRWRASQKAQLHEVPVVIRELDDIQTLQIALIENLQRQDLNAIEEAKGYQKLVDEFAFSPEDVGQAVNKSRSHVANLIRLLALPQSVQDRVVGGELSAGHARALIGAQNPALLASEVIARGLSVRQTEKLAAAHAGRSIQSRSKATKGEGSFKDPNILALEKDIGNILGMTTLIHMDSEFSGKISVEFKSLDQLDEVLLRLSKIPKVLS